MTKQFENKRIRTRTIELIALDHDGVIDQDRNDFVRSIDEWIPIGGSMDAIAFLTQAGYTIAVTTDQPDIGRKCFTVQGLTEVHTKVHCLAVQADDTIGGVWFCPHTAVGNYECRKPKPGMVFDIVERFKADAAETWLVNDSLRDLQAVDAIGDKSALVLTGGDKKTPAQHEQDLPEHTQIFDNLLTFSQCIMREDTQVEETAQAIL